MAGCSLVGNSVCMTREYTVWLSITYTCIREADLKTINIGKPGLVNCLLIGLDAGLQPFVNCYICPSAVKWASLNK